MRLPRGFDCYRPNSGGDFETVPLTPTPMAYQRPYTHENDVTVRLRRCLEPLPDTARLWRKTGRPLRVEPLELEIAQPLPEVCARHGRPATSRTLVRTCFYDTDLHPRFHSQAVARDVVKSPVRTLVQDTEAPVSTIVVGEWPACDRCVRGSRRYRWFSRVLLWLMAGNLVALVIAAVADIDRLIMPLALALFPGSLLGLVVALLLLDKSRQRVTYRPIYDERFAFVEAHADFRLALERLERPSLEK
ncbi:hypothetical protein GCM10027088_59850 [Nocardia goodfellowii]